MDTTTLALAVDSSQVNTASVALQKMAAEGFKAETVAAKLASTAQAQGRALNSGIVRNAALAADSIKGLTSATSALAGAQDFSRTTAGLAAAATQANTATGAVRAFSAAIASAAAGGGLAASFQAPKTATVQQIAQTPVSALARSSAAAGATLTSAAAILMPTIDSKPAVTATNALDKFADQAAKAKGATEGLTSAAQEQGRVLAAGIAPGAAAAATGLFGTASAMNAAAVQANSAAAAFANARAAADRASEAKQFNPFGGLGVVPAPAQTSAFSNAAANAAKQSNALGQANKLTAFQTQQLSFQLNDFFVQVASGQSPLTALIQQGSQLSGTFGGIGGAFKAVTGLFTPARLALGGVAAGIGAVGYAYMEGQKQSKDFNEALINTGNFAGLTEGKFNSLIQSVAQTSTSTINDVRLFANELQKTGEIGPQVFASALQAADTYSKATGKTAAEVAADFAKMSRAPSKFAEETNKSWNYLSGGQMKAIRDFEDVGRAADAQGVIFDAFIQRGQRLKDSIGGIDGVLNNAKRAWFEFWDAAYDKSRDDTIEAKIARTRSAIESIGQGANPALPGNGRGSAFAVVQPRGNGAASGIAALNEQLKDQQRQQFRQSENAFAESFRAQIAQEVSVAEKLIDADRKHAKARSALQEAIEKRQDAFRKLEMDGRPVSAADQKTILDKIRKDFAPPKGPANNEASQVLREQLGEDLGAIKALLDAEKNTIAFQQREMQGLYQAGRISLTDFFEGKRKAIADGVAAETSELDKEIARLKEYQAAIKDPSEKVKIDKQINQVTAQKERVGIAGGRETVLIDQEAKAALKALDDQVTNYRANLLQMAGDELGAARLRAEAAKTAAGILAGQSGGRITAADIERQSTLTEIANQYADAQRRASDIAQNTARAEEAAYLVAEQGGKSLLETENAVYAVRSKAVDQLGTLATKARELADASTDPRIKQFAADLALQYAKAADAIDPALNRLRGAQKDLAAGIAGNLNNGLATLPQEYSKRRQDANKEAKEEKARYDERIQVQQGYLAQAASNEERARIRKRIKDLEAQRESAGGESKGKSLLQAVNANVVQPMASQAFATVNKLLVTDPLQKYLEGQFRSMTEGGGVFASFFKDTLGIKDQKVDPKMLAEQAAAQATNALSNSVAAQTAAADASTAALNALANAANAAAGTSPSRPLLVEAGSRQAAPSMGDFTRADRALEAAQSPAAADPAASQALADARSAVEVFGATSKDAAGTVTALAQAAGKGNSALGLLPSIVSLFQTAVSAMNLSGAAAGASGGGAGIGGAISSLFGSSGGSAASSAATAEVAADVITSFYFHKGGVVGGSARTGAVPSSVFANAPRYHTGGIVGEKPDGARSALAAAALKAGEVPAILMRQEEVLRRDDPRHRDNLGADTFAKIMAGEKPWAQSLAAQAARQAPDNSVSSLLKNIAGDTKQGGENSASVLGGLLSRLGVQDEPVTASALRVHGARELGGPVSAGKLYRVNEKRPELLNVGNRQYLMMGSQGGKVDPNPQTGGARPIEVTNNFHLGAPTNHSTQRQMALAASRSISDAARRNG